LGHEGGGSNGAEDDRNQSQLDWLGELLKPGFDRGQAMAIDVGDQATRPEDEGRGEEGSDPLVGEFATNAFEQFGGHSGS
jgi:hypothetical protein